MTNKIGHGTLREGHLRLLGDIDYAESMAKELLAGPRPPKPIVPTHFNGKLVTALTESERNEFIISMQCASTQATLRRDPKDDADHWNRQILNWRAVPEADTSTEEGRDKANPARGIKPVEYDVYKGMQRSSKNTIGDSKASSVDKEKRERGIQAFTYSKPADLKPEDLKRVVNLQEIKSEAPIKEETPGLWKRLFGRKEKKIEEVRKTTDGFGIDFHHDK